MELAGGAEPAVAPEGLVDNNNTTAPTGGFLDNLRQLFDECDVDCNGSLGPDEFSALCAKIGLNEAAAQETFRKLDIDSNQRVTFEEFAAGFNQYSRQTTAAGQPARAKPSAATTSLVAPTGAPATGGSSSRLSPLVSRAAGRKSASPLGVVSLGSSNSTGNLLTASRSTTSTGIESCDFNSVDAAVAAGNYGSATGRVGATDSGKDSMIVYGCDDYEQPAGNSGQFGSLMSNHSGSLSQLRNMQDLLDCVQKLQSENQILSQIFFKDKREREEYISQLGEEFDQQVREVEERANRRAREELEGEKRRLREMMQAERETLQHHYQTIEKMSHLIKSSNGRQDEEGSSIDKVRSKLEDTYLENRQLKKSLLDTKTDVAMIWKEMEKLKRQYEDKLTTAYERHNETKSECDHIKHQLTLMKDSNRKLQDASDILTNYITDKVEPVIKSVDAVSNGYSAGGSTTDDPALIGGLEAGANNCFKHLVASQSNSRKGSILSEYLLGDGAEHNAGSSLDAYDRSTNGDVESFDGASYREDLQDRLRGPGAGRKPLNHSLDSNLSSRGDVQSQVSIEIKPPPASNTNPFLADDRLAEADKLLAEAPLVAPRRSADKSISPSRGEESGPASKLARILQQSSFHNSNNNNITSDKGRKAERLMADKEAPARPPLRTPAAAEQLSQQQQQVAGGESKSTSCDTAQADDEPLVEPADGPGTGTFNIILVGDSFVGKSSFAARFMEGDFVQGLISNCSIDFKTKVYKIDGTNYTINLWDTAGQERFRSITASYFRKAEGIILMYDVTEKRTYLNVRNWMSTIADTAPENVAVLLIGNKIDLRQKHNEASCVPHEEGVRLAKEYGIFFLETSVKTGKNLTPSMGKLIRLLAKNNSPEEEDQDLIRLNDKSKTFNCMPKSC